MGDTIKLLLADSTYEPDRNFNHILKSEGGIEIVGKVETGDRVVEISKIIKPDVVLLDAEIGGLDAMEVVRHLLNNDPNVLVVMVFTEKNKTYVKRAMASGARDFLVKPFTVNSLIDTIKSLYELDKSRREALKAESGEKNEEKEAYDFRLPTESKIITLFSTKGGVGKSLIAINLAVSIADKTKKKVALVDLDLMSGDIALMLDLYPKRTIVDMVKDMNGIDKDTLQDYLVHHSSGLSVLPAPISPEQAEYITSNSLEKIIYILARNYDYIVIDTGPSFKEVNLTALDMSNHILFVTTLDLPSVKSSRVGLDIMKKLNYEDNKVNLILNRYSKKHGISIKDLEKTAKKSILNVIPMDDAIAISSINTGAPFMINNSRKPIAKKISEISDFIIQGK